MTPEEIKQQEQVEQILKESETKPTVIEWEKPSGEITRTQFSQGFKRSMLPSDAEIRKLSRLQPSGGQIVLLSKPGTSYYSTVRQQYTETGIIPESIGSQIIVPEDIEKAGASQTYKTYVFREYIGMDVTGLQKQLESQLRKSKWYMSTQPIYEGEKTFEQIKQEDPALYLKPNIYGEFEPSYDYTRYKQEQYKSQESPSRFLEEARASLWQGLLNLPNIDYWSNVVQGKGAEYLYKQQYGTGQAVRSGDMNKIAGEWLKVQTSWYENVILPAATAGVFKYIQAGRAAAKAGTLAQKGYKYFVTPATKAIQYGAIPTIIGTDIGYTAAIHKDEPLGGFGSTAVLTKASKMGLQFTSFGYAYRGWSTPSPRLTGIGGKIKTGFQQTQDTFFNRFPRVEQGYSKIIRFKDTGIISNRETFSNIKTGFYQASNKIPLVEYMRTQIPRYIKTQSLNRNIYKKFTNVIPDKPSNIFARTYGSFQSIGYGIKSRIQYTKLNMSKTERYNFKKGKFETVKKQIVPDTYKHRTEFLSTSKNRVGDFSYEYKYHPEYVTPRVEQHLTAINQKTKLGIKKSLMKMQQIETKTFMTQNPLKPYEITFISKQYGKPRWSAGKIKIKGQTADITGKTYQTLGEKNIQFATKGGYGTSWKTVVEPKQIYQVRPFTSNASSKVIGEWDNLLLTRTTGGTKTYTKTFLPGKKATMFNVKELSLFDIQSASQTTYAGETYIKGGFIQQHTKDVTKVLSEGKFMGKTTGGWIRDSTTVFKSQIKGKDYFGETAGFDTRGVLVEPTSKLEIIPHGGNQFQDLGQFKELNLVSQSNVFGEYPGQIGRTKTVTLSYLENLEAGITSSSYWNKSIPASLSLTSNILSTRISQSTIPFQSNINLQSNLQSNLNIQNQLQRQIQNQLPVQLSLSTTSQIQNQRQLQLQLQMQKQISKTVTITPTVTTPNLFTIKTITPSPTIPKIPTYKTPTYTPTTYPPFIPLLPLPSGNTTSKKIKKQINLFGKGYRYRRWNVLRMEDLIGGKI